MGTTSNLNQKIYEQMIGPPEGVAALAAKRFTLGPRILDPIVVY